jgi:hypothetical protein
VITFVAPLWYRNPDNGIFGLSGIPFRYSLVPVMMLASAVAVLIAPAGGSRNRTIARIGRPVFAVYMVALIVTGFSVTNARSSDPLWSASLTRTYRADCIGAYPNKLVEVRTWKASFLAPDLFPVTLPCRDLSP